MAEYIEREAAMLLPELPKEYRHYQTDNLDDAYKDAMLEALEEIENGMCRIKERRSIWQNNLVYALCQAVRLLLMDKIKEGRK